MTRRQNHVTLTPPPRVQPSRRLDHRPTAAQSPLSDNGTGRESGAAARPQSPDGAARRPAGRLSSAGPPVSRGGEWQGGRSGPCHDLAGRGGEYDVALAERTEPSVDLI